MQSQYHEGELEAQRLAGEAETAAAREGMMQPRIAAAAVRWLGAQTTLVTATLDAQGRPWASVVTGPAGFLRVEDAAAVLRVGRGLPQRLRQNLMHDPRIGVLIIDLGSRQRLRVNGTAVVGADSLQVRVSESFFNCPKYITRRVALGSEVHSAAEDVSSDALTAADLQLLHETDVLFLATLHPVRGLDVSHRGGDPGFVQVEPDGRIRMPDYPGNSLFNSLGNLLVDARVGVAVPDLRRGTVLELTGHGEVTWDDASADADSGGTRRVLHIKSDAWRTVGEGLIAGSMRELSPFNPHALE